MENLREWAERVLGSTQGKEAAVLALYHIAIELIPETSLKISKEAMIELATAALGRQTYSYLDSIGIEPAEWVK